MAPHNPCHRRLRSRLTGQALNAHRSVRGHERVHALNRLVAAAVCCLASSISFCSSFSSPAEALRIFSSIRRAL